VQSWWNSLADEARAEQKNIDMLVAETEGAIGLGRRAYDHLLKTLVQS
jgi:hypothetical protein